MEEKEDLLFKIWDKVNDINTKVAVIQDRQDSHIKKQDVLYAEHIKLKEDFTLHKGKFLIYAGSLGSLFGAAVTFFYNLFFKHN